jgi:hypothetical protein
MGKVIEVLSRQISRSISAIDGVKQELINEGHQWPVIELEKEWESDQPSFHTVLTRPNEFDVYINFTEGVAGVSLLHALLYRPANNAVCLISRSWGCGRLIPLCSGPWRWRWWPTTSSGACRRVWLLALSLIRAGV